MSTLIPVNELVHSLHSILSENPLITKNEFESKYKQMFESFETYVVRHYKGKIKADLLSDGKFYSEDILARFSTIVARLRASS